MYPNDLNRNRELEEYVGHLEHGEDGEIRFPPGAIPLIKTHDRPRDESPAIYVVRDGRAASVSIWKFYKRETPLEAIIEGQHYFGTWSSHVQAWKPYERQNTLLLKYENMTRNLPGTLKEISKFLKKDILREVIPDRSAIAGVDGRFVNTNSDWRSEISDELLERFNRLNGDMLRKMGYLLEI